MKLDEPVKIFPGAQVFGDVEIGKNCSIWHGAIIRGDSGPIRIGKNTNIQDNCVLHSSLGLTLKIGDNVSVGHCAVVHGCVLEDNVLIGMNATVLDGAKIGKNSIVGAGAVVGENKEFPENSLILGVPGKFIKETSQEQREHILWNAEHYVELANEYDE
ncbi:gamma carbonic anhydrase family protein [Methanobrevibacter olleyae]|uniref:Carbonic anhydrase or acetyltransferase, isoleucine patch superfamily n=1 Tax=Methanobrevibacter olleyae TaxID=294671 RepID=A0A126QY02_METOL|nr:gamma carbonic anhydrase family protein [Methanobrevibacter olleyae]AMK14687.1 hexapeptide repeat-containing acetyltransferase [Methanobrevibacter olleyae]SFL55212.1 Carbonic anhydrase or acetyltransferase, isoleucine patch superfamily [Methanobrevibacter olleyae]